MKGMDPGVTIHLATCSYRDYRPEMGVAVGTSIGKFKGDPLMLQCDPLKPWSTFRKMDSRPLEEQCARYQRQLTETKPRVRAAIEDLQRRHLGATLVLMCHCHLPRPDTGPMGCHRRWAADWFAKNTGFGLLPELGAVADTRPSELFGEPAGLF